MQIKLNTTRERERERERKRGRETEERDGEKERERGGRGRENGEKKGKAGTQAANHYHKTQNRSCMPLPYSGQQILFAFTEAGGGTLKCSKQKILAAKTNWFIFFAKCQHKDMPTME